MTSIASIASSVKILSDGAEDSAIETANAPPANP